MHNEQRPGQSHYGIIFHKLYFDDILLICDRFRRKSTCRKSNSNKSLIIIGHKVQKYLVIRSSTVKLPKSQRKTNYNQQNENNNLCLFIFETIPQVLLLFVKVSKRSRTFLTVITQMTTFSLNLGTSTKNFKAAKFS